MIRLCKPLLRFLQKLLTGFAQLFPALIIQPLVQRSLGAVLQLDEIQVFVSVVLIDNKSETVVRL